MAERLRVCHVITYGTPMAGTQFNTYYSLRYQQASFDVSAVMGNDGPFGDACRTAGIPATVIPFRNVLVDPARDMRALLALISHFRQQRPHIVHTHSSKAGILGRLAARLAGIPIIIHTVHGPSYHEHQPMLLRDVLKNLERLWAHLTDYFVTVSTTLADELVHDRICSCDRVSTVVSGIDFDTFPSDLMVARRRVRAELDLDDDALVVVSVGHLMRRKGYDVLVRAAERVLWECDNVVFLIVGTSVEVEDVQGPLQRQIDKAGLAGRVLLCGARNDVPDVLAAADVYVQASWNEGLSRGLVEAMYSGVPVVATEVNATSEVVKDGESGYLVPAGDDVAMGQRVVQLLRCPRLRETLGNRARKAIGRTRSVEVMGRDLDALYRRLARDKHLLPADTRRSLPRMSERHSEAASEGSGGT